MDSSSSRTPDVEKYRPYLHWLARLNIGEECLGKVDSAEVVQQTLLQGYKKFNSFRGQTEAELKGWLRKILSTTTANNRRALGTQKRDVTLERSISAAVEDSSCRLDSWLAAEQSSPSSRAARNELMLHVAKVLGALPDDQRTAIEMRYLQQAHIVDICQRLNRSEGAVTGLLTRGMKTLRERMRKFDPQKGSA